MWQGDPEFIVTVDGVQQGGVNDVSAVHSAAQSQAFTFQGNFGPGQHDVGVTFINDAYGGTADTDRNLYVDSIDYDGQHYASATAALYSNGTVDFIVGTPTS